MRSKEFKLVRNVWRASTAIVVDELLAVFTDENDCRVSLVDERETLSYRIQQAVAPVLDNYMLDSICDMLSSENYDAPRDELMALNPLQSDVVNPVDVDGCSFTPHVMGNTDEPHVVGIYWKTPKRGNAYPYALRVVLWDENKTYTVPCDRNSSIKFKTYGITGIWALVKSIYRDMALKEAKQRTKDVNTANTYHKVKYTLKPMDSGEAS